MKVLYYTLFGLFGLLGFYFVLTSLFGRFNLWGINQLYAKTALLIATGAALYLLYRAWQLGEQQGRWGAGASMVILAVLAFQGILLLSAFVLSGKWGRSL